MDLKFQRYCSLTQLVVQRGVAECAEDMSWSKGELSRLLVLSDKVGSLLELNPQGDFKSTFF